MTCENRFKQLYNFLKKRNQRWYKLLTTPHDWGLANGIIVPMGYEFDIYVEFTLDNDPVVYTEIPENMTHALVCTANGTGKILSIGSGIKIVGHNHPMCAEQVNGTSRNMLPTSVDITGVLNVANALGSGWSFIVSRHGLCMYWAYKGNSSFNPEEYDSIAIECLSTGDLTNAIEYLKHIGVDILYQDW